MTKKTTKKKVTRKVNKKRSPFKKLTKNFEWQGKKLLGRPANYEDANKFATDIVDYFKWTESNPLHETHVSAYMGEVIKTPVERLRAMTIRGCCRFIGIGHRTWYDYRNNGNPEHADYKESGHYDDHYKIICWAEDVIYNQKLEGAAAGLFNAAIIIRELGLKDTSKLLTEDEDGNDAGFNNQPVMILPPNGREVDPSKGNE